MRWWGRVIPVVILVTAAGCGGDSTSQLIAKSKARDAGTRLRAVRALPQHREDAAEIVPALIEALQDEEPEVRRSAAFGLGTFGEQAKDAVPALQAALNDPASEVRKAAGVALGYIDPSRFPAPARTRPARG